MQTWELGPPLEALLNSSMFGASVHRYIYYIHVSNNNNVYIMINLLKKIINN